MSEEKIPAKKSLGQNFLKSKTALIKMIEAGEVNSEDIVLEVGPGKGVLTEKLLTIAKKVIAVEKDDRLVPFLKDKFATDIVNGKLEIIHGDILDFNITDHPGYQNNHPSLQDQYTSRIPQMEHSKSFIWVPSQISTLEKAGKGEVNLQPNSYKIIANIPYYITGLFLRKFLETDCQPTKIVVMVQKEIAERIVANDKKESLLSLSVKAYGTPKKVLKVDKENFSPAPNVDSAILLINNISKKFFTENNISEKSFFEIIHAGFAHKRKILLGNLKEAITKNPSTWQVDGSGLAKIFAEIKLSAKIRAEDLTLSDWAELIKSTNY